MPQYKLNIQLEDAYTRRTTRRFTVDAVDQATAMTNAAAFVDDYAAFSEAEILKWSLAEETTYADAVIAGANIDEGVTLTVEINNSEKRAAIKIPAPGNSVINADGSVDLTATIVTDFIAHFTSGFVLVSDGETVTALKKGVLDK